MHVKLFKFRFLFQNCGIHTINWQTCEFWTICQLQQNLLDLSHKTTTIATLLGNFNCTPLALIDHQYSLESRCIKRLSILLAETGKYHCSADLLFDWLGFLQVKLLFIQAAESKENKQEVKCPVILPLKLVFSAFRKAMAKMHYLVLRRPEIRFKRLPCWCKNRLLPTFWKKIIPSFYPIRNTWS